MNGVHNLEHRVAIMQVYPPLEYTDERRALDRNLSRGIRFPSEAASSQNLPIAGLLHWSCFLVSQTVHVQLWFRVPFYSESYAICSEYRRL